MEVFLKWRAKFRAIADLPVPQTPLMKINLLPFSISSSISFTTSAWVLLLENFKGLRASLLSSRIESELEVFLFKDHIWRNRGFCL